jgi:hypothetical protein
MSHHHNHCHIDQAADNQCDNDFSIGEAQHHTPLVVVVDRRARLRQAGMQIDGVRRPTRRPIAVGVC